MTKNLVTLNYLYTLCELEAEFTSNHYYGVAINLASCESLIAVDLDNCDIEALDAIDPDGPMTTQQKVYYSLRAVPKYTEISSSGAGLHIIFSYKNFSHVINNKFIFRPCENVEIFVGGKTNKMLSLTGVCFGAIFDSSRWFEQKIYKQNRIIQATTPQLQEFINCLSNLSNFQKDSNITTLKTRVKVPSWLSFKKLLFEPTKALFVPPEQTTGYLTIKPVLLKLQNIAIKEDYGVNTYPSRSELDFMVFNQLIQLYPNLNSNELPALIHTCVNYYTEHFGVRASKSPDYLFRTCYNAYSNFYSFKQEKSIPQTLETTNSISKLIVMPLGILAQDISLRYKAQYVFVENRDQLFNEDWDVYEMLLGTAVKQGHYSIGNTYDVNLIKNSKCELNSSLGHIARYITGKSHLSSSYYKRVLESLTRLSKTTVRWSTVDSQGCMALLEFQHNKLNGSLMISFTNLIAWFIQSDIDTIRLSKFKYTAFYLEYIFTLYLTSSQRQLYRFLVNNCPINSFEKRIIIDSNLLEIFYTNYSSRRNSLYKARFLQLLKDFQAVKGSDITIKIQADSFFVSRKLMPFFKKN
jgi:hypothetical protein